MLPNGGAVVGVEPVSASELRDLYAAAVQHGQLWRAWTALTLHLDVGHIVANLGAGIWFGWLAGRLIGPGTAWALIVNGAAAANLVEGLLAVPDDRSAGASTAVFTALGLPAAAGLTVGIAFRLTSVVDNAAGLLALAALKGRKKPALVPARNLVTSD